MDCFMIGNGFDLHYCLPTAYTSFVQVVKYLCAQVKTGKAVYSVAQVFRGIVMLEHSDMAICNCYNLYKDQYDSPLGDEVKKLVEYGNNNVWFSYLSNTYILHPQWVDFEKEISQVLNTLTNCFDKVRTENSNRIIIEVSSKKDAFILNKLHGLFIGTHVTPDGFFQFELDGWAITADPEGSDNYVPNWTQISKVLFDALKNLAEMISIYMDVFVSRPLELSLIHI